mgnify:CR=1 FL=1
MTLAAHVAPVLAWASLVRWWIALAVMLVVWALSARRAHALFADPPRARWITRYVDEPMFLHFAAGLVALPLFLIGALAIGTASITGCAPSGVPLRALALPQAALAAFGGGLVVAGWGLWGRRRWVKTRRIEIGMRRLHGDLDGYRIAHLSDLHIGSYDRRARGLQWARLVNATEPDLVVVTGDLVTSGTAYYDDAAAVIGALRAPDGVYVVLGNHDQWDDEALARALGESGARVLRNEWVKIQRGSGALLLAGVDDAYTSKDDLDRTLANRPGGVPTVLLAHYPDFFRGAREHGVELTLSGHTHGGQFGLPFLADRLNLARALRQRPRGMVRQGESALYVNAGLGTTGPPLRIGVAPEIAVLVLRTAGDG